MTFSASRYDIAALARVLEGLLLERGIASKEPQRLQPWIEDWLRRAELAWPAQTPDADAFVRHIAERFRAEVDLEAAASALHVEDLYLAFLAGRGDVRVLQHVAALLGEELNLAATKLGGARRAEETQQIVWQKLLTAAPGKRPRILDYSGRGRLKSWFRVAVVRSLLDELRHERVERRALEDHAVLAVPSPDTDPETQYLRRVYGEQFATAFEESVLALTPEERNVLRAYYAEGLGIDQLSSVFGIHRATAARRVRAARDRLMDDTRRRLRERLKLSAKELESIMRLLESQLHLSVQRLFESK